MIRFLAALMCLLVSSPVYAAAHGTVTENFAGRTMLVYVPQHLAPAGRGALVVVLHGGLGNAYRIAEGPKHALNMDAEAEKDGFVVAYLSGTHATRLFDTDMLAWNAGGSCCGQPAINNIDDVGYIAQAVAHLAAEYGIDPHRVYGIGHSNGAMMVQRLICETDVFAAGVAIAGPLNLESASCPSAKGKHILGLHGAQDENVPIDGGQGTKGFADVAYQSEEHTQDVYKESGAIYDLHILQGADHALDHVNEALQRSEGISIPEAAVRFFGLTAQGQ